MEFLKTTLDGVLLIKPIIMGDKRGYFSETFRQDKFEEAVGHRVNFIQDNESRSDKGVLRGLHFQAPPFAQSKLVRVLEGEVLDIAVDIRQGSPTYGQHYSMVLSAENKQQLFIPRGFAHGFVVLSDTAVFSYKVDNYYSPESDSGIAFDDPDLAIDWKFPLEQLSLSDKDKKQTIFKNFKSPFKSIFKTGVKLYEQ